ncbi:MAG TPA: DUF1634 domain-containing protein [Terracidiphilus sp.]|jgi:uncharacterized membrane protein|nr:DUF1634 domain-containing protein [Terracidiphilus sp.]
MEQEREHGLEQAMGRMLQIGVMVAALVVLAGGALYLLQFGGSKPDYGHFEGAPAAVSTVSGIVGGALHMDARSLIGFGILLLIATPICRVIFGVVGFAMLRDKLYTAVSAVVLIILLYSFVARR